MINNYKYNGGSMDNKLNSRLGLPARLDAEQTADVLGFEGHDIPVLVSRGFLRPLGKPKQNSRKYFATVEILQISNDFNWLGKATAAVSENWKEKNANRNKLKTVEEIALGAKLE